MKRLKDTLLEIVKPLIDNKNIEFVDLEIKGSQNNPVICIYVDEVGGIPIKKCVSISRELNQIIETENIIKSAYRIDVSSPGMDRPLKTERDFARNIGRFIKIDYQLNEVKHERDGEIVSAESEYVIIKKNEEIHEIFYESIDKALIQIKWK
ncbi:MAG: hypothetical protein DWQ05_09815 [Calditrichaeota bacterium]|nr:MAG: hypothetical protein DWQ05_09815 [Calditrichota bacterium]